VFLIDTLDFYNATANIWSYCSQEADGNIQAGNLSEAGVYKGSRVQVYQNGAWSEYAQVQYYKPGGGSTAEIKIRPSSYVGGNPQTGIDWSTVAAGTPIRFYTGKDLLRWTNQFGTQCGGIYNFNTLVFMVGDPVSPPNDSSLNISSNFADGGICWAQSFTQCLTPQCPVQIGDGTYPYTPTSFQPYPGGGGNSCGSKIGNITCT
jgi:hypothetical protein